MRNESLVELKSWPRCLLYAVCDLSKLRLPAAWKASQWFQARMRAVQTHRGGWKEEQTRPWTPAPILHISAYKQRLAYSLCTFARVLGDVDAELNDVAGEDLAGRTLLRAATQPLAVDEGAVAAFSVLQVELTHTHEQNQYGFFLLKSMKECWEKDLTGWPSTFRCSSFHNTFSNNKSYYFH